MFIMQRTSKTLHSLHYLHYEDNVIGIAYNLGAVNISLENLDFRGKVLYKGN
jgi:hypothetical protein